MKRVGAPSKVEETGIRNIQPISCAFLTKRWLLCVVSLSVFTTSGVSDCMVRCLVNRINLSAFISQRKIAAVTPDHWCLTCGIQTGLIESTFLHSFPSTKQQPSRPIIGVWRVASRLDAASLVGLYSTRLCWCIRLPTRGHILVVKQRLLRFCGSGLDSTRLYTDGGYASSP